MKQSIHKIKCRWRPLFLLIVVSVAAASTLRAQSPPEIRPLTIGDTVPDMVFQHMLNYKDSTARLSDFRGKPVILDFFATWCGSCIEALPKLDSLQKQFGDSVQILVVGYESNTKVAAFFQNNTIGKKITIPVITEDSVLSKLFPHRLIPHEVWVDREGEVKAITQAEYVTESNLNALIAGHLPSLPLKSDVMAFNINEPLFGSGNENTPSGLTFSSALGRYRDGIGGCIGTKRDSIHIRWFAVNMPILWLYSEIVGNLGNRIILEVKDTGRYIYNGKTSWQKWAKQNTYCYEMIAPKGLALKTFHTFMLQDVNRYLGLNGHEEKRLVSCWALTRIGNNDMFFRTKGGEPKVKIEEGSGATFYNQPLKRLIDVINTQVPGQLPVPIVIDETNYIGNVDLKLQVDNIHNIQDMRNALQSYNLDLLPVKRELKMFVLSDID